MTLRALVGLLAGAAASSAAGAQTFRTTGDGGSSGAATAATAASARIFAYTGNENQAEGVSQHSLYSIDPVTGVATLVQEYGAGAVTTKPDGATCVPGDHNRLIVGVSGNARRRGGDAPNVQGPFVVGMPGVGTDAPLIVRDVSAGVSFCDDGIENLWGIVPLGGGNNASVARDTATTPFAAMSSAYDAAAGTFSFAVGALSVSASPAGPAATFAPKLRWDQDSANAAAYEPCAQMSGDQLFVTFDARRGRLFIVCQDTILVEIDTGGAGAVVAAAAWTAVGTPTAVVAAGFDHVLGFSELAGLPVGTAGFGTGIIGFGYLNTTSGDWANDTYVQLQLTNHGPAFAYDAALDVVHVWDVEQPSAPASSSLRSVLLANMTVSARVVSVPQAVVATDMVWVPDGAGSAAAARPPPRRPSRPPSAASPARW